MQPKRILKFGTDSFFKCTPNLFRRIGNALFSISSLGGTFAFLMEDKKVAMALVAFGVFGKFLTEFFSEEEVEKDYDTGDVVETPVPSEDTTGDDVLHPPIINQLPTLPE